MAFYHLVRAEVLRFGGDPLPDRQSAQAISKRLRSDLFKCYMELENETEELLDRGSWYADVSHWSLFANEREFINRATLADILIRHGIPFGDPTS